MYFICIVFVVRGNYIYMLVQVDKLLVIVVIVIVIVCYFQVQARRNQSCDVWFLPLAMLVSSRISETVKLEI